MTYFLKTTNTEWSPVIPSIVFPLIYNDSVNFQVRENDYSSWIDYSKNILISDIPLSLYIGCWQLSSLIIADIIEDKLSYEKADLKYTDLLSSDLSADSLDFVEIVISLEKTIGVILHEGMKFQSVTDLIDYIFLISLKKIERSNLIWSKSAVNLITTS